MSQDTFHLGVKGLITNGPGRVLLLRVNPTLLKDSENDSNNKDYWDLPGGRVETGEGIEDTLRRELQEEIGAEEVHNIKPVGMVLSNIRIPIGNKSVGLILSVYSCDLGEDVELRLSNEHIEMQWFDKNEAAELLRVKYPAEFCELITKR